MKPPFSIRFYLWIKKQWTRVFDLILGTLDGFCLGVAGRKSLHALDEYTFGSTKEYQTDSYNRGGLFPWEQQIVDRYFQGRTRILVGGAGGGREMLALAKQGFQVEGFECHPDLVSHANELLKQDGVDGTVRLVERDESGEDGEVYDGIIIGWCAFMHIQGRRRRVEFLRGLRNKVKPGGPVLISFWHAISTMRRRLKITAFVGRLVRRALGRELLDLGDTLQPHFVHYFDKPAMGGELSEAGFEMVLYEPWFGYEYAHAVAVLRQDGDVPGETEGP